jgi:hypothetical protein
MQLVAFAVFTNEQQTTLNVRKKKAWPRPSGSTIARPSSRTHQETEAMKIADFR